jgi:hypothetical protein
MKELLKPLSELAPKAGTWLTLKNIQLGIGILIELTFDLLKLFIYAGIVFFIYQAVPWTHLYLSIQESLLKV